MFSLYINKQYPVDPKEVKGNCKNKGMHLNKRNSGNPNGNGGVGISFILFFKF